MSVTMDNHGIYEGVIAAGLRLAELPESEGGWKEYFSESDAGDLRIKDDLVRAQTCILLENAKRWMATICRKKLDEKGRLQIDETTRAALVGGFSDYLFPIIRAGFPTNPVNEIISVQPTTRRTSTIVYWNWIVGAGKGSFANGQRLMDANRGKQDIGFNFSNDFIDAEIVATGTGSSATATGTLKFADGGGVRPGTLALQAVISGTLVTASDNGNGAFLGGLTGTINYNTGAFSITYGGNIDSGQPVVASYRWDSEGSSLLPQVDVQIVTSTVETERRALILNYSMEAMQDVMAEFGVSLEPALVSGAAEQMNYEIARQIVHELFQAAPVVDSFSLTPPSTQYNQQDHFKDLVYVLNKASNTIQSKTQKGYGNFIIVDEGAANIIESLPAGMFVAAPRPANINGMHFIGTLLGRYRVYKDLFLVKEAGSSANGNILMGFKGTQFFEAGFVWSPYQLMYTTDSLTLANMITQKGMASRYATKMVNRDMYCRISIVP